jgi:hypothetical protein
MPLLIISKKAFQVPIIIRTKSKGKFINILLPLYISQANQGSNIIIATISLLKALGIKPLPLLRRGFSGLIINIIDGTSIELTYYTIFNMGVYSI